MLYYALRRGLGLLAPPRAQKAKCTFSHKQQNARRQSRGAARRS
jgi:hypothetical protein